jgi:hypothetical protein
MIKLERTEVFGFEAAIRGMRNPMNSWDKSDTAFWCYPEEGVQHKIGENDLKLMKNLSKAGNDHAKFLRMINVTVDITAPLYWWKEFDTYKVGTVANSCSTMHKIHTKEFTLEDFSHEHLDSINIDILNQIIYKLNFHRKKFIDTNCKDHWWQMIQLLPSSYNQKRTVQLNYQVLKSMYFARRHHKLNEWVEFCKWCETLPYFKEVCIDG